MPFTSKAQARYMFLKHPKIAKEFSSKTPSIKALPEHSGDVSRAFANAKKKRGY